MKLKNKKASILMVAAGLMMLAGLIVLVAFIIKVRSFTSNIVDDTQCKDSILNHVSAQKITQGDVSLQIECPTKYYTAKPKKEEDAKLFLAESLRSCWGTWGRGELQLFSRDNTYCHICSVVKFDTDLKYAKNLPQYLATEKIRSGPNQGMIYAHYLQYFSTDEPEEKMIEKINTLGNSQDIDLQKDYAIIFVYARGKNQIQDLLKAIAPSETLAGITSTGIIGGVIGSAAGYGVKTMVAYVVAIGGPVTWMVGGFAVGATTALAIYLTADVDYASFNILREYNAEELKKLGCIEAPITQDDQENKLG